MSREREESAIAIMNSSQAIANRKAVQAELNSTPRINYSHAFEKSAVERGEWWTEKSKWLKEIKKLGFTKKNVPMKLYLKA